MLATCHSPLVTALEVARRVVGVAGIGDLVSGGAEAVARTKAIGLPVGNAGHVAVLVVGKCQVVGGRAGGHRSA